MYVLTRDEAPRYQRDSISSHLLASARTCHSKHLTTTLVEMQSGGVQKIHSHEPEQTYFILEGGGSMTVADETTDVKAGDCIFIPSGSPHGLVNTGNGPLRYYSAAGPSFSAPTTIAWLRSAPTEQCSEIWVRMAGVQESSMSRPALRYWQRIGSPWRTS